MNKLIVRKNDAGRTLLKFLERMLSDVPKSRIEKAFRNKDIKVNNERTKDKTLILNENDVILVYGIDFVTELKRFSPVQKDFEVIFEDRNILVVEKHTGYPMHGTDNSLDNQILQHLKFKQKDSFVPSSIGRLDKVTSGVVIYAKNYPTLKQLKEKAEDFKKMYIFKSDLPAPITTEFKITHDEERKREVCGDTGKDTKTIFTFEKNRKYAELVTGRKHQIRASLSKLGYPIWGDRRYGGKPADRVYLHCFSIKLSALTGDLEYLNKSEFISNPNWN